MQDDEVKEVVKKDSIIQLFGSKQVYAMGGKTFQKKMICII